MKYLLFGTGDCYNRYKCWFGRAEIVALIDNSAEKQGSKIDGLEVKSPEEGVSLEYDAVVILSFYVDSMKEQLIRLGVNEEDIYHFYDLHKLKKVDFAAHPIQCFGNVYSGHRKKKILLLNQNLAVGGPALTLLDCARVLKKNGYQTIYGSMIDGPLRDAILKEDIPVVIDENMLIGTMRETEWVKKYDLILCNAINYYYFLSERECIIPCVWWLHDSEFFYKGVDKDIIAQIPTGNLSTYAVGKVAKDALVHYAPQLQPEYLLYGTKDVSRTDTIKSVSSKIRFATLGFVENRKGQDILIRAVSGLDKAIRSQCEFYIIGKNTSALAENIMYDSKNIPEVIFTGMVENVHAYLTEADVLICPSREDPMPAACAEAMMHRVSCIVSDAVGTAEYIKPKCNGMVFQSENVEDLKNQIIWCVEHRHMLADMGREARKIYDEYFEMSIFERKILQIVSNI